MISKPVFLLLIPLSLSAFTHLWNPVGFPVFHIDEGYYMDRTMVVLEGFDILHSMTILGYYDHPYFGQLFLAAVLGSLGYPDSINSAVNMYSVELAYMIPRVVMGVLAVIDTLLIYKICEFRYNNNVALVASLLFAVMPISWMLRSIWLENILLPFLLSSVFFSIQIKYRDKIDTMRSKHNKDTLNIIDSNKILIAIISGVFLGIAIFTKETAFLMIPLIGYTIYVNSNKSWKIVGLWLIPVILIPLIWPITAALFGEFDKWLEIISYQTNRVSKPLIDSIMSLVKIDPLLMTLGISGLVFAAIRKDFFLLLWIIPFLIFEYGIDFVSSFHFIIMLPVFCISASILLLDLSNRLTKKSIESYKKTEATRNNFIKNITERKFNFNVYSHILKPHPILLRMMILPLPIAIFGLICTTMLVVLNLNSSYFNTVAFITAYLPDKGNNLPDNDKIVTVISRESDYIWIPKYVFSKDQHEYESYFWDRTFKTGKYLLIVNNKFKTLMSENDQRASRLYSIYNGTTTKAIFERASDYHNLYKYPYTSINDLQVLDNLGIASGTSADRLEIRTNF